MHQKRLIFTILIVSLYSFVCNDLALGAGRIVEDLSQGWRFQRSDEAGAESRDYRGDSKWEGIDLPHTWNAEDIFDDEPGYYRGIGWYRKTFSIPQEWEGKRIVVRFEAACIVATVWINGKLLGEHKGSWTPFEFNITNLVKPGSKDNVIAVRVDNRFRRDVMPHHMDFNFMGGLHREVSLIATDPAYILSTRVLTPKVSEKEGEVYVVGQIRNSADKSKNYSVQASVTGPGLKEPVMISLKESHEILPGQTLAVALQSKMIPNPKLWSPDEPNLYEVTTQLLVDDQVVDEMKSPLGFRWYRFDPEEGFFLNGKPLKLKGVNRHDDYPGLGWALPKSRHIEDMKLIKELGANFVRTAHYTQHPVVLETCDRLGLMVWEELPFDGEGPHLAPVLGAKDLAENLKQVLHDMIRRDANHPSIIVWSLGNENMQGKTFEERKAVAELTKELHDLCKKLDPTRPTAVAINKPERAKEAGLTEVTDILGYNIYDGWYSNKIEDFAKNVALFHKANPTKPLVITEYGADNEKGLHTETPKRMDFSEEHACRFHEFYWKTIEATPYISGSLVWNVFDFAVEQRTCKGKTRQTIDHLNQKGIFTYDRRPKDLYYFYKSQWTTDPMVYIVSHTWTERTPGVKPIKIYSNGDTVELSLNGKSLGVKRQGEAFVWDVPLAVGENELHATATHDGKTIVDTMTVKCK